MASDSRLPVILALGTTQTLAWASSYYLPAILADPIGRDLGMSANWIFAAFSAALVISALLGPRVGRQIDLFGGRPVLCASNLTIAAGLILLGVTTSIPVLLLAWLLLGIGMGFGLYDAAFAALGRIFGDAARGPITGITLMAGFASTVGWPLTAFGLDHIGWRDTCFAWAAAHLLIGLPLNFFMLPKIASAKTAPTSAPAPARVTWIGRSLVNSFQVVPIETTTLATRIELTTKYTPTPRKTAATWPALRERSGPAIPRLTASPRPAAIRTCPALKADLTSGRRRAA